jgi:hypothetical protein
MENEIDKEIKETQKKLIPYVSLQLVAAIPMGFAFVGLFAENPTLVHPLLANLIFVYALLGIGLILFIPVQLKMPPLTKKMDELRKQQKSKQ